MVQRRGEKQQNHTAAVQAIAGDGGRAGIGVNGLHQQQNQPDDAEHKTDTVTNAIGNFLCQRVSLLNEWFLIHYALRANDKSSNGTSVTENGSSEHM